jgi:hypothetical protein
MRIDRIEIKQEVVVTVPLSLGPVIQELDMRCRIGAIADGNYWHGYVELSCTNRSMAPMDQQCFEDHASKEDAFACSMGYWEDMRAAIPRQRRDPNANTS